MPWISFCDICEKKYADNINRPIMFELDGKVIGLQLIRPVHLREYVKTSVLAEVICDDCLRRMITEGKRTNG